MIPVEQTSSPAHQVQPTHELKLSLLELPWSRRPSLFQSQHPGFSRFPINHCTPYIYTIEHPIFLVNHCTPYTYIESSTSLPVTHCTPYTYTKDCAIGVINPRQRPPFPNHSAPLKDAPNPSPASLRVDRQSTPTLDFSPSLKAATSRCIFTPDLNQNLQRPTTGSKPQLAEPPVHLEFW
jgi:hypothetical protein